MIKHDYPKGKKALAILESRDLSMGRKLLELYKLFPPDSEAAIFWHSMVLGVVTEAREAKLWKRG
jgi:hypothetical protein